MRTLRFHSESFPIAGEFAISRGAKTEARVVVAEIAEGARKGRGECVPYARYGESIESVTDAIRNVQSEIEAGLSREALQERLPPGAARNALDCALWDLEAKKKQTPVWWLAGLREPKPAVTAFTLSLAAPDAMAEAAAKAKARPLLKVKLGRERALECLSAVRKAAPDSTLIVDANEAWDMATLEALAPELAALGVALIEQPLPAGKDQALADYASPVPLCADESVHDTQEPGGAAQRLWRDQHQARQDGRAHRGVAPRGSGARGETRHHGGLHGGELACHGARFSARARGALRRSRRAAHARARSAARDPLRRKPDVSAAARAVGVRRAHLLFT